MGKNLTLAERLAVVRGNTVETPAKPVKKTKAAKATKVERTERKVKARKARKTTNRKAVANGTIAGHKCLVQKNRKQFIADHDWAQNGTSTADLARAVIAGAPLVGVWAIGPKTVARLTEVDNAEAVTVESQGGKPAKAVKGKKGKKAKVTVEATDVVESEVDLPITLHADGSFWRGEVRVSRTGKVLSEAQIVALDAPRRADGKATPKREWALREALAETSGGISAAEIDEKVAEAYAEGIITV